jgi:protein SCO1/2
MMGGPTQAKIDQRLEAQVPLDLTFRDEAGRVKPLREFTAGKPVVLVLAYYRCPRLCNMVLNGVVDGLKGIDYEIGREFNVITVSIDPAETPALAAAKKQTHVEEYGRPGAAQGWHFLTGEELEIKQLADRVGFRFFWDSAREEYAHASGIMLLTPDGRVSRYFYGINYAPRDLKFGLTEASNGKISPPLTERLRLLCYGYDPATGRYTLLVFRIVKVAGALTVLVLAAGLTAAWVRERRRARAAGATTTA